MRHTTQRGWILLVLATFAWLVASLAFSSTASAQRDATLEAMLEDAGRHGKAVDTSPIPTTNVSEVNRLVHWRLWKRVVTTGAGAGEDELTALEHDGRSVGFVNQNNYALAVASIAATMPDIEKGRAMFKHAERLASDLPYVYFAHARYIFDRDPGAFQEWGVAWASGMQRSFKWPDTRFPWALKLLLFSLFALAMATFVFAFGQIIRQFGIVAYDAASFLPKGFSSNQTVVLLLAAAIVPGLIFQSPILGLVVLMALVSIPQQLREKFISVVAFGFLASLTYADGAIDDLASYSGSNTQELVHAQYASCDAACRQNLDAQQEHRPDDRHVLFTRLLAQYRTGSQESLKEVAEICQNTVWSNDIRPWAQNLAGAALLSLGEPDQAIEVLKLAQPAMGKSAAPSFNLMRAYQVKDDIDAASGALREATSRNLDQVSEFLRFERRDVNSFLIAEPLPLSTFWRYHQTIERERKSTIAPIWQALAGPKVPLEWSLYIGLCGIAFVLCSLPFSFQGKTSTPCPRCMLARDPRDNGKTGNHQFCLSCYRTFVTGAGLDYHARVHNESVLGRRERLNGFMRRIFSVILPGSGHHLAGRSLVGFLVTLMLALGGMMVLRPMGLVRPIHELYSANWGGTATIGWFLLTVAIFIALTAAARDVDPLTAKGVK